MEPLTLGAIKCCPQLCGINQSLYLNRISERKALVDLEIKHVEIENITEAEKFCTFNYSIIKSIVSNQHRDVLIYTACQLVPGNDQLT